LSIAPLAIFMLVIVPGIQPIWHRNAPVAVIPAGAGDVAFRPARTEDTADTEVVFLAADGLEIPLHDRHASHVLCDSQRISCYVLLGLGFERLQSSSDATPDQPLVVIRPDHGDGNPLWPYLNDPEFLFLLSLSLASIALIARRPATTRIRDRTHGISPLDFFLTEIARGGMRFFKRIGDLETRIYAEKLANCPIDRPVFVAGLARSGTTILLEKISALKGVATHRYRDFPFILTPVIWNRFLSLFGAKQEAVERPHKDTIKITRDSPEAFEEPVWQWFFGNLHDGRTSSVLDETCSNPAFESFYRDHLRKILFVRHGSRYVSKGNYNITRIRYITKMFKDARIVVPVRHPFTHVHSLVRQHRQFLEYARQDPRVPEYMRAVGHYEFGPQRMPIITRESNATTTLGCWEAGRDAEGYAWQWKDVYRYVAEIMRSDPAAAAKILVIRFEDLCQRPEDTFERLLRFIEVPFDASLGSVVAGITTIGERGAARDVETARCWPIVEDVASLFGYSRDVDALNDSEYVL
jgi:hypothetical protein